MLQDYFVRELARLKICKRDRVWVASVIITSAVKYPKIVIPANAGIQINTGCRIKSGMTKLVY